VTGCEEVGGMMVKATGEIQAIPVGIVSVAAKFPSKKIQVEEVCRTEGVATASIASSGIGIDQVRVFEGEWRSDLALAAAEECLSLSGLKADDLDVIIDFSVLPQDYVVPSWSMSNKIQHQLGAGNAFNLGFGGCGPTNLLVALRFASALIKGDEDVKTALLVAADVAIPGNRIVNADRPFTVLGDGASALIISAGKGECEIIETELQSEGANHDVVNVPGGGLAHPDRLDLYRLEISPSKYKSTEAFAKLKKLCDTAAVRAGVSLAEIVHFVSTNISQKDQEEFADTFGLADRDQFGENRKRYGHVQATDLVINLSRLIGARGTRERELGLICCHGWGFTGGAALVRC
jgi:3-oxoacyl-[acyl-carrier-protein] synthase III